MSTTSPFRRLITGAAALALGMAGALAMGATASADEGVDVPAAPVTGNINPEATGSIIIHKHVADETSESGNPKGKPLEGVQFNVTEVLLDGKTVPLATAEGWAAIEGLQVADIPNADFTLAPAGKDVTTDSLGEATAADLHVGLYLVTETGSGDNLITEPSVPFLVTIPYPQGDDGSWLYNVDVYPKNVLGDLTNPTKAVGTPDHEAALTVGAKVPFTITAPVAKLGLDYNSFSITDALSAGLGFDSWGDIKVGALTLLPADYSISGDNTTVTFNADGLAKLNADVNAHNGSTVTAVINTTVKDLGQLDNTASIKVNGTPATTPTVTTNWAKVEITKVDANSAYLLAGATFELYAEDGTTKLAEGTTDENGQLSFVVWVGNNDDVTRTVKIKETVAPQGYVLPADPWLDDVELTAGKTAQASVKELRVGNAKFDGPWLPDTGSTGTMAMTAGGLVLAVVGLGALVVARRRRTAA